MTIDASDITPSDSNETIIITNFTPPLIAPIVLTVILRGPDIGTNAGAISSNSPSAPIVVTIPASLIETAVIAAHGSRILDLKITDPTGGLGQKDMVSVTQISPTEMRVSALHFNVTTNYDPPYDVYGPKPQLFNYHAHGHGGFTQPNASKRPELKQWKYWSDPSDPKYHYYLEFDRYSWLQHPSPGYHQLNTVKTCIITSKWNQTGQHPHNFGVNHGFGLQYFNVEGAHPSVSAPFYNTGKLNTNLTNTIGWHATTYPDNPQVPIWRGVWNNFIYPYQGTSDPNDGSCWLFDLESNSLDTVAQVRNPNEFFDTGPIPRAYHLFKENIMVLRVVHPNIGNNTGTSFTNNIIQLLGAKDQTYAGEIYEVNHYSDHLTETEIYSEVQRIRQFWIPDHTVVSTPTQVVFTSSGTWSVPSGVTKIQILLVGGGGSGGPRGLRAGDGSSLHSAYRSGGGAGGIVHIQDWDISGDGGTTTLTITVGAGGTLPVDASITASNGEDTIVTSDKLVALYADGGGHGGYYGNPPSGGSEILDPAWGGCGGGRHLTSTVAQTTQHLFGHTNDRRDAPSQGTVYEWSGFGTNGGGEQKGGETSNGTNRGGGGARWTGGHYGTGGDGMYFGHIFGDSVGDNGWFSSGGQTATTNAKSFIELGTGTKPPFGGGGVVHDGNSSHGNVADGMPNTGGGGGGAGNGGSGIVIIKYWT